MPPLRIAHRAAAGELRENSLAAVEAVVERCDVIELDVRRRFGGELVLAHDPEEREQADRLEDVLRLVADHDQIQLNLDLKQLGVSHSLTRLLQHYNLQHRTVCSGGFWEQSLAIRHLCPGVRVALTMPRYQRIWARLLAAAGERARRPLWARRVDLLLRAYQCDLICVHHRLISPKMIAATHAAGGQIWAWTVDDCDLAERLSRWGVDGICSNRLPVLNALGRSAISA